MKFLFLYRSSADPRDQPSPADMQAGLAPRTDAALVVIIAVVVMMVLASMPSTIVIAPTVIIVPVAAPEPMEVPLAGKVDVSRAVPAPIERRVHVVEPIPRPGANEHAVDKIIRPPVAIRSTTKRIIRVVSVRAGRGNVVVAVVRTDMDPYRNLGLRRCCCQRNRYNQQPQIFEMSHDHLPCRRSPLRLAA